jgi:hypothetical protein
LPLSKFCENYAVRILHDVIWATEEGEARLSAVGTMPASAKKVCSGATEPHG